MINKGESEQATMADCTPKPALLATYSTETIQGLPANATSMLEVGSSNDSAFGRDTLTCIPYRSISCKVFAEDFPFGGSRLRPPYHRYRMESCPDHVGSCRFVTFAFWNKGPFGESTGISQYASGRSNSQAYYYGGVRNPEKIAARGEASQREAARQGQMLCNNAMPRDCCDEIDSWRGGAAAF